VVGLIYGPLLSYLVYFGLNCSLCGGSNLWASIILPCILWIKLFSLWWV